MFTKIYCILNNILNYYSKPQIKYTHNYTHKYTHKYTHIKFININPIYNQYNSNFLNKKGINTFQNL